MPFLSEPLHEAQRLDLGAAEGTFQGETGEEDVHREDSLEHLQDTFHNLVLRNGEAVEDLSSALTTLNNALSLQMCQVNGCSGHRAINCVRNHRNRGTATPTQFCKDGKSRFSCQCFEFLL